MEGNIVLVSACSDRAFFRDALAEFCSEPGADPTSCKMPVRLLAAGKAK
jgi:hypothetical protein